MPAHRQLEELQTDILVVGGGPAGSALAATAAGNGFSVVVLERSHYEGPRVGEHLTPDVQPTLESLGILDSIKAGCHRQCLGIRSAWGNDTLFDRDYLFNAYGHGWNLDREQFDAIIAGAAGKAGATVLTGTQLARFSASDGGWLAHLKGGPHDGQTIRARFLVDATGRAAAVARHLGGQRLVQDKLVALCAWLPSPKSVQGRSERLLIEAAEGGWWYATRLPRDRFVAVFLTDHDLIPSGTAAAVAHWTANLADSRHVKALIGCCATPTEFRLRAANSYIMDPIAGENWLAVGDAATAFDPLSSMGILKALDTGVAAASTITRALGGDRDALPEYVQEVTRRFSAYLAEQHFFYSNEQRWPEALFWKRRGELNNRLKGDSVELAYQ